MSALGGYPYSAGINKAPEKLIEKRDRVILYGTDALLKTLVIIYHGDNAKQHQILQFRDDYCEIKDTKGPMLVQQRLPTTKLEFSQDDYLREDGWTFII